MGHKKHVEEQVWTAGEPRTARDRARLNANADVVSLLQTWLTKSGATASAAGRYYRRGNTAGRERTS